MFAIWLDSITRLTLQALFYCIKLKILTYFLTLYRFLSKIPKHLCFGISYLISEYVTNHQSQYRVIKLIVL